MRFDRGNFLFEENENELEGFLNVIKMSLKFGQIQIASKDFYSTYQVTDIHSIDLDKIAVSGGVKANKHDTRYTIGYEVEPGKVIPLYIKTPKNCSSSGVTRYNDNSTWKMGFNVSEDPTWVSKYKAIWDRVEELLFQKLSGTPLSNEKYINPKLITWEDQIKTRFNPSCSKLEDHIGYCYATGILKIGSVYQQGSNYHLQVFLKECKYKERDVNFQSQLLSDDEDYDTVY